MNIGSLIKLIGDVQPAASRTLELRPGQTVRAQVVELMGDNEALLQIGGTQLVAKLETPLKQGQTAVLQVQSETAEGKLVLKRQEPGKTASEPTDELWKSLGFKFGVGGKEQAGQALVRELKAMGVAIDGATAGALAEAAEFMPEGENPQLWLKAAAVAIQRGLPMTEATVASLRQIQSGPSAHELLEQLSSALKAMVEHASGEDGAAKLHATRLLELLEGSGSWPDAKQLAKQPADSGSMKSNPPADLKAAMSPDVKAAPETTADTADIRPAKVAAGDQQGVHALSRELLQAARTANVGGKPLPAEGAGLHAEQVNGAAADSALMAKETQASEPVRNWARQMLDWMGAGHENQLRNQLSAERAAGSAVRTPQAGSADILTGHMERDPAHASHSSASMTSAASGGAPPIPADTVAKGMGAAGGGKEAVSATSEGKQAPSASGPLDEMDSGEKAGGPKAALSMNAASAVEPADAKANPLKGAQGAHGSERAAADPEAYPANGKPADEGPARPLAVPVRGESGLPALAPGAKEAAVPETATIKSALLSLLQSADLPPAVKDSAQQLLQHITGQQLLLSPERSGTFFSQLTLQIPLQTANGGQTASVHVQSRRNGKGGLDASNCRLLFDLKMDVIGDTVVDVAVADKVVSLTVFNGHPAVPLLADAGKTALSELLHASGYRLLGMKVVHPEERRAAEKKMSASDPALATAEPYKGVDLRV
ncbi:MULTISPECIES: hypothetical protein [unclassified Paenibacillus]|uniref:hypothetical protein n=1 Tax=unclassified Paenibacillus TaxID=185978 RepID=UPI000955F697|nr:MULTISPECIES: hypothetical protein [unclassified Paenibacillus]ASS65734.1 hypothetical protein CIC07_05940 [Paenibacillus sp. RUD330]SIQ25922.1 hypothetical protein SAMN05880555_1173 [Paenibacillus sp. RU4X]SIQ47697.1 hypothetical protein SAMN05880570_1172 [Paenibacillus sp. RU4T]